MREELAVGDVGAGGDQGSDIDLATAAEDDAALVDDQDLTVRLDVAEDLARRGAAGHAVERHPVGVALLIEIDRGPRADVERGPVQNRLRRRLPDADIGLTVGDRLGRQIGTLPERGAGHRSRRHLQPARRQSVRHTDRRVGGGLAHLRRRPCRGLHRLHGLDRLRRPRQRARALLGYRRCLLRRERRRVRRKIRRRHHRGAAERARMGNRHRQHQSQRARPGQQDAA